MESINFQKIYFFNHTNSSKCGDNLFVFSLIFSSPILAVAHLEIVIPRNGITVGVDFSSLFPQQWRTFYDLPPFTI